MGGILASLIYNFILFPYCKDLNDRLAILKGTYEPEEEAWESHQDPKRQQVELYSTQSLPRNTEKF